MTETETPTTRQLTSEDNETLQSLFPNQGALSQAGLSTTYLFLLKQNQISSPEYFKDLVSQATAKVNLPRVYHKDSDENTGSVSLYTFNGSGELLMPLNIDSSEGKGLSFRISHQLVKVHLEVQLQYETRMIVEQKTTSNEQIERIGNMMRAYERFTKAGHDFRERRDEEEDVVLRSLLEGISRGTETPLIAPKTESDDERHVSTSSRRKPGDTENTLEHGTDSSEKHTSEHTPKKVLKLHPGQILVRVKHFFRRKAIGVALPGETTETLFDRRQRLNRMEQDRGMKKRFVAAVLGGLSVIVPMLIMAIHPSKVKTLVTASVAVVLFALALAWKSSAQVEALLATTAEYAAVLVVFVGVGSN